MSVIKGNAISFFSYSPAQTRRFGSRLGALVQPGDVILLRGDLGSGKTHFAQGIAQGLGVTEPVRSPTFTLINEYQEGRIPMYHIDLYRLEGDEEIATIGLEEYLDADGVVVVEWPEKGERWLPEDALHLYLEHVDDHSRSLTMDANSPRSEALLQAYKRQAFALPE
ncbi:MAG: tRNA (adenosine(37)-N6)-threonylcarbamoyltransferase complex ATPase subunit type 1 TsaE [Chloroflexota bacterium]|nr:tRNA (adenosine(37)-N6)-threonylcarbamoyltransferase complex ATPase subunit type 1 TsaE [Chloroflexota bacterium]